MVVYVVSFVAGCTFLFQLPQLPALWLAMALLSIAAICVRRAPVVSCFIAGFLLAAWQAQTILSKRLGDDWLNREVQVTGTVVGLPDTNPQRQRFVLRAETMHKIESGTTYAANGAMLRLSWYRNPLEVSAGERWKLTVKLRTPNGFMNPGGFDYERWLFQNRIVATGYVRDSDNALRTGMRQTPMAWLQQGRLWLKQRLQVATNNLQHSGLILALSIGDRSAIDQQQWQRFIDTGTNHLLAISGLHISLVGAFAGVVAAWLWRLSSVLKVFSRMSFILNCAAFSALCYAALAGFSVPTQRALLMFSTLAVLSLVARHQPRHSALALALLIVCLVNPLVVLSPGFWMSFAAVAILYVVYSFVPKDDKGIRFMTILRGHLLITIGMYPLGILFFGQMSLVAPLANFIAVPVVGMLLTPVIFIASMLAIVKPALATVLLTPVDWILQGVDYFLALQARWEYALVQLGVISGGMLIMSAAVAVVTLLPVLPRLRWLATVMLIPVLWTSAKAPAQGSYSVVVLDVGQGTAVVVQTHSHTLVYDAGPAFSSAFNSGDAVILPYLQSKGIEVVDRLIISHADRDHIGGAKALIAGTRVNDVLASAPAMELPPAGLCSPGQSWRWDDIQFQILHPLQSDSGSRNDRSCVLLISTMQGKHTLLAGDVEVRGEQQLLTRGLPQVEVLLAPHHGSNTSSTESFVQATHPRHVVHSAGYRNRYGFPHAEVSARYRQVQSVQYETAKSGAVSFVVSDARDTQVEEFRKQNPRLWTRQ